MDPPPQPGFSRRPTLSPTCASSLSPPKVPRTRQSNTCLYHQTPAGQPSPYLGVEWVPRTLTAHVRKRVAFAEFLTSE